MEKFSQTVKDEIIHGELSAQQHCLQAELAAVIHIAGSIHLTGHERLSLSIVTESASVARRTVKLLKKTFGIEPEIRVEQLERLKKLHRYALLIPSQPGLSRLLYGLNIISPERTLESDINAELVRRDCCRTAFLRGTFLAGGSITDPQKKTNHLELVTSSEEYANSLAYLMNLSGLKAKISRRKGSFVVYLKDGASIARFISLIGAHAAVIKMEEVKIIKGLRGEVNRLVNCETANLEKSIAASWEQVELISRLVSAAGLSVLPEKLRQTAELRLSHPEANLMELGELHLPPISKSAVNHRLRQIRELAKKISEKEGIY